MPNYSPKAIEPRWQQYWRENKTFRTPDTSDKPKFYVLDMFPYPSGEGLHVGHPEGYTATDILARYRRMCGFNVLHPMGWDAFGLPAEQFAIQKGVHPRITTEKNIANFRRQIQSLGFSYDWDREVDTTDPKYYRWTQWIFLTLFDTWFDVALKRGRPLAELPIPSEIEAKGEAAVRVYRDSKRLVYQAEVPVNWCQALGTVLANEEVIDGKSERGDHPVVRIPLKQWMLRITDYADRLLEDLELVEWPNSIKEMQRNWIGRSEGAEVDFRVRGNGQFSIRVFTTRPDTLFGATYMVLSPEHPLVEAITTPAQKPDVKSYQEQAAHKSDLERTELAKKKTGVFTGAYAINPVTDKPIPIWIADYVLATYGTGAIMAVPAHDERDFEFARQYNLPMQIVVQPTEAWLAKTGSTLEVLKEAYCEEGIACNSGSFSGDDTRTCKARIINWLAERGIGARRVNFKLRDWLFSRQRYWGEPFPILHELDAAENPTGVIEPLSPEELPLTLPPLDDFKPSGKPEPPLGKATDWLTVTRNGKRYRRETNTMPQWAGSCWYYLRYIDPHNEKLFCDPQKESYWMSVDLYVGGAEHAVLHLLYSRFWHKVLFDRGHVSVPEPFRRLINQGMILGEMEFSGFQENGSWISAVKEPPQSWETIKLAEEQVEKQGEFFVLKENPKIRLDARAFKMSKSRKNVIDPDVVVQRYGADSLRLYEMFMGPLEATKPWSMRGVEGVHRFLSRVWRLFIDENSETTALAASVQDIAPAAETQRKLHLTIQKVTYDLDNMGFNTAISAMMEYTNHLTPLPVKPRAALEPLVLLLAPFAPHLSEELWNVLGHSRTLAYEPWPKYNPELIRQDEVEVPVQINGKIKLKLMVAATIDKETMEKRILEDENVRGLIGGKQIKKIIAVPGKLVNIVLG